MISKEQLDIFAAEAKAAFDAFVDASAEAQIAANDGDAKAIAAADAAWEQAKRHHEKVQAKYDAAQAEYYNN